MHLHSNPADLDMYLIANAFWEEKLFELPGTLEHRHWYRVLDTRLASPQDILPEGEEASLKNQKTYSVGSRSVVLMMAK